MERVHLEELQVSNFRNLKKVDLRPHSRFNIIEGRNGMGKTNLLEAIYMFGVLRSFRTSSRNDLIRYGANEAKVKGIFTGAAKGISLEITTTREGRRINMEGKTISSGKWSFQNLPMVLFHPATMGLVQDGPVQRRRFLDRALFQAEPVYASLYRDYSRVLANRNVLLKRQMSDDGAIEAFDPQLADLAAQIVQKRNVFVEKLRPFFIEAFKEVSRGLEVEITYLPKVEGDAREIMGELKLKKSLDLRRGYTSLGPHADEILFEMAGKEARKFASQGQQRMVALSLKIAETNVLAEVTERIPIMLLDDVSSELDREKNLQLFEFLHRTGGQVFITTTHLDHILIEEERTVFSVSNGEVGEQKNLKMN